MSIIVPTDFKGENTIAQVASNVGSVDNTVQLFINKYESIFLKELLGTVLASEFKEGLALDPIPQKWIDLRDTTDLKPMLIDYIYYWYIRNQVTNTAGSSEVKAKTDNATYATSTDKMCRSWNEMSKMARLFDLSTETYPSFVRQYWRSYRYWFYECEVSDIFYPINNMNI